MSKISEDFILKQMELGPLENFLYFIGDARVKEIAVVDPAWDVDYLCSEADKAGLKITSIFLTHGHPDHVNGLEEILARHNVPAYISRASPPGRSHRPHPSIKIASPAINTFLVKKHWQPGVWPGVKIHSNSIFPTLSLW